MSTSYTGLGTASGHGEGQGARRELFNTALRHDQLKQYQLKTKFSEAPQADPAPEDPVVIFDRSINEFDTGLRVPERINVGLIIQLEVQLLDPTLAITLTLTCTHQPNACAS